MLSRYCTISRYGRSPNGFATRGCRKSLELTAAGTQSPLRKVSKLFKSIQEGITHSFRLESMVRNEGCRQWPDPYPCRQGLSRWPKNIA